jgi:hypothetical protein
VLGDDLIEYVEPSAVPGFLDVAADDRLVVGAHGAPLRPSWPLIPRLRFPFSTDGASLAML